MPTNTLGETLDILSGDSHPFLVEISTHSRLRFPLSHFGDSHPFMIKISARISKHVDGEIGIRSSFFSVPIPPLRGGGDTSRAVIVPGITIGSREKIPPPGNSSTDTNSQFFTAEIPTIIIIIRRQIVVNHICHGVI